MLKWLETFLRVSFVSAALVLCWNGFAIVMADRDFLSEWISLATDIVITRDEPTAVNE